MSIDCARRLARSIAACFAFLFCTPGLAAPASLRFLTWRPEAPQVWERLIAQFERNHPALKVVREVAPASSSEFHDLVTQKLHNRDAGLDVFMMDVVWPAEFAAAGWALPLDEYFPATTQKEFLASSIQANRYYGRIYGVPLFVDAGMLYFRKDLLQKYNFAPPRTWPELVEQAKTILAQEHDPYLTGYSGQFKQYEGLVCNIMEFIMSNGGFLWDEQRRVSALQSAKAKAAVRFVRDQIIRQIAHRGVLAYQESESLDLFVQGKAVFHRNWPYAWELANDAQQSKVAGRVGVMSLPSFAGEKSVATLGGWQLAISRFSRQPAQAWQFIDFLTGHESQKQIALATGRGPARVALYRDSEVLAQHPHLRVGYETLTRAEPRPRTPVYAPLSNIMQRYFSAAIAVADSDIDRSAGLAARDMDRVLDLLRDREPR
jgi:multiple sugar transport system substrate-binding protein